MARPLRVEVADGIYHVTARGNERRAIYRDDADRARFLEVLASTLRRFRWRCLAYCLMTNHYHLLLRTLEPNLARGMRDLNGVYAQWFNRRHRRVGHLFQGRYRAILVEREEHFLAAIAYVVRNPVRAGMCEKAGDWPWSSHRGMLGERPPGLVAVGEVLSYLATDRQRALLRYCELAETDPPVDSVHGNGAIAGSDEFVRARLGAIDPSPETPAEQHRVPPPPLAELLCGGTVDAIARAYEHGYTMPTIARELSLHPSTVSRQLSRYRAQIKT